jgi:hypothetical protein
MRSVGNDHAYQVGFDARMIGILRRAKRPLLRGQLASAALKTNGSLSRDQGGYPKSNERLRNFHGRQLRLGKQLGHVAAAIKQPCHSSRMAGRCTRSDIIVPRGF